MAYLSEMQLDGVDYAIKDAALTTEVASLANVARSGSYNDLTNKPTIPSGTITAVQANGTNVATSGTANIPAATTSKYGVTQLSSSTSSTSTSLAATPSAVKAAYDLANGKQDKLTSGTNIKTINGESILGSGNITIEGGGGSSGGGPNVVQVGSSSISGSYNNYTVTIDAADNTIFIVNDTYQVSNVNINLGYIYIPVGCQIRFMSLNTSCTVNFTGGNINWANGSIPELKPYCYAELSICSSGKSESDSYNVVMSVFEQVQ